MKIGMCRGCDGGSEFPALKMGAVPYSEYTVRRHRRENYMTLQLQNCDRCSAALPACDAVWVRCLMNWNGFGRKWHYLGVCLEHLRKTKSYRTVSIFRVEMATCSVERAD
jgi:hypothetical protein